MSIVNRNIFFSISLRKTIVCYLGNKKAAFAAIKNRPKAAIRGFNCYYSSLLSTLSSSFVGVMSRMYKVLLDFVSLLKMLTSTFVFS